MRIITIVLSDGVEPDTVYIGSLDPGIAAVACGRAHDALYEDMAGMTVDRASPDLLGEGTPDH